MVENLVVMGTSHIALESVREVRQLIEDRRPVVVAVELDVRRARALLDKKVEGRFRWRDIRKIGIKGFLFSVIGAYVERKLGERVGSAPGSEMRAAMRAAHKVGAQVALIDQDIMVTLKRFSHALTWLEKWRLFVDVMKSLFGFGQKFEFDLSKVPAKEMIKKLTLEVKDRYPSLYAVLVSERNEVMAHNLVRVMQQFEGKLVVAVVGAGHEEEIVRLVKKYINARV